MQPGFQLFPDQASTLAPRVDNLYFFMLAVSAFFAVLVTAAVIVFAIKYRRRSEDEVGVPIHGSLALELIWTGIPFILAMVMFVWGASVYFAHRASARRDARHLRRRQAVDVEVPAPRGAARDQHAARAGRTRRSG